jgi:hypothetical protein
MKFKLFIVLVFSIIANQVYSQLWSKLDFRLSYPPNKLYVDSSEDKLYFLGKFTKLNDTISARGIVSWNGSNYQTYGTGFDDNQTLYTQTLADVIRYKNKLYVGGYFNKAGNVFTKYLAQWDGNQWDSLPKRLDNGVMCFKNIQDTLYIAGSLKKVGNVDVEGIVKYDGTNFYTLPSFYPYNVLNISVLEYYNGHLYVGGLIKDSTGYQVGVMKLVGNKWTPAGQGIQGSTVFMYKLKVYQNKLIATGVFYQNSVNVDSFIQAWNDTTWSSVGGGTGEGNGAINDMAIIDGKLYCAGVLTSAGGIEAQKYAIWDGVNWCSVGSSIDNTILAIANYKDTIYIAGGFNTIDSDTTLKFIAKWTGGNFTAECGNTTKIQENINNINSIFIFPNPAKESFHLNFSSNITTKNNLLVFNNTGELVLTLENVKNNQSIDVSKLSTGIYFAKLISDTKVFTSKISILK